MRRAADVAKPCELVADSRRALRALQAPDWLADMLPLADCVQDDDFVLPPKPDGHQGQ